jgi:hypothetical protein
LATATRLSKCSTVSGTEFFDAPAERHISGAQVPKFPHIYLTAEGRRFVELGEKAVIFGDGGVYEC